MKTASLLVAVALLGGCSRDLALPAEGDSAPRVDKLAPGVAIAALRTRVRLFGSVPPDAKVFLGPLEVPASLVSVGEVGDLVVEVSPRLEQAYQDATGESLEGQSLSVRIATDLGEATAPGTLRVFSGQARVDSVEPDDPQPGQVLLLRGDGFDPEILDNDQLSIVEVDPTSQKAVCSPPSQSPADGMPLCALAPILMATSTQLVALVPQDLPAEYQLSYRNLAYKSLEATLEEATSSGKDSSYVFGDPAACLDCKSASGDIPTSTSADAGTTKVAWADPGTIWVELAGTEVTDPTLKRGQFFVLAATGRISYPKGTAGLDANLQVYMDDQPLAGLTTYSAGADAKTDPNRLKVTVPEGAPVGPHVLQVVNPLHRSGLARMVAQ